MANRPQGGPSRFLALQRFRLGLVLWVFAKENGTLGTARGAGRGSGGTSCSRIRFASIAWSEALSRRRRSVITSSRIGAMSTNSGSVRSSRSASGVMTALSGLSRLAATAPALGSMVGRCGLQNTSRNLRSRAVEPMPIFHGGLRRPSTSCTGLPELHAGLPDLQVDIILVCCADTRLPRVVPTVDFGRAE